MKTNFLLTALALSAGQLARLPQLNAQAALARKDQQAGCLMDPCDTLTGVAQQQRNILLRIVAEQITPPAKGGGPQWLPLMGARRPGFAGFPIAGLALDSAGELHLAALGDKTPDRPQGTLALLVTVRELGMRDVGLLSTLLDAVAAGQLLGPQPVVQEDENEVAEPVGRMASILSRYE